MKDKLEAILKEVFLEPWMDEGDWKEFEQELFMQTGTSYEKMESDIKEGVKNGYKEDFQLKLIKDYLLSLR
jgi:hypothetical protein